MFILFQTVVALFFIYLVSSIINSLLVESLAQWLNLRGDFLRLNITNFFKNPKAQKNKSYNPFWRITNWIKGIFRKNNDPKVEEFGDLIYDHFLIKKFSRKHKEYPSYIDAKLFSSVIYDLLLNKMPIEEADKATLAKEFNNLKYKDSKGEEISLKINFEVRELIQNIILKASSLGKNLEDVLAEIEAVYNIYMERVSQWYKARLKWILFGMGLLIASLSNLDSINLFNIIKEDPQIRSDFIIAAKDLEELKTVELNDGQKEVLIDTLLNKILVKNDSAILIYPPQVTGETVGKVYQVLIGSDKEVPSSFANLELGLAGYSTFIDKFKQAESNKEASVMVCLKILGLFITGIALSYGATFWFDLLKKLIQFG